ncbi:MAG: YhgN family NAAT transporter [Chlamydiia bacterium]|nr:YhgN family NAAT transporter [Chlamydiia bacterium]
MNHSLFTISFALFLMMDPIGNIPVYIAVLKDIEPRRQRVIIIRELLIALAVIILFTFVGEYLLNILNVGQETILISGGIILFMIAVKMIFPSGKSYGMEGAEQGEPFIVPLAIPLVAGPSVLAAVMIYSHRETMPLLIGSVCIAWAFSTLILFTAPFLKKILGPRGIIACERLMGLLLTLLAIQMFLEGISLFLKK